MSDPVDQFKEAMRTQGLAPKDEIIADGKLHRFAPEGERDKNNHAWYVLHLDHPASGAFGSWKGDSHKWTSNPGRELTASEKITLKNRMAEDRKAREEDTRQRHAAAKTRAADLWSKSVPAVSHPYLERKQIKGIAARTMGDLLVIPVTSKGELVGLQFIPADGQNKTFMKDTPVAGAYCLVGPRPTDRLVICEGYATASSIHEATELPVFAAFNAGNLVPVARALRERLPDAEILIAADDDRWTTEPVPNPGVYWAAKAQVEVAGELRRPVFRPGFEGKPTDFNDLHTLYGLEEVRRQILEGSPSFEVERREVTLETVAESFLGQFIGKEPKHNQIAEIAMRFMRSRFLYETDRGRWYYYEGFWKHINTHAVQKVIDELLTRLGCKYQVSSVNGTLKILESRLGVMGDEEGIWNTSKGELPLKNGILNLETKELRPYAPEDMFNWRLPHSFDPGAQCPTTKQFLQNLSQGSSEAHELLVAFLWAVLYGRSDLQQYLEIIGMPGTGKSTYMKLARFLVGEMNFATTTMQALTENKFETANFYGKRLVLITDADEWGGSAETFKALTGEDPLRFEEKNKQSGRSFTYEGMVILAANRPVIFKDKSTALVRRRIPVTLDKLLDPKDYDPNLEPKLKAELPGLINWLLSLEMGRTVAVLKSASSGSSQNSLKAFIETSIVAQWINDNCIFNSDSSAEMGGKPTSVIDEYDARLYPNFLHYCSFHGQANHLSVKSFRMAMDEICLRFGLIVRAERTMKTRRIHGVRTRTNQDFAEPLALTGDRILPE